MENNIKEKLEKLTEPKIEFICDKNLNDEMER